MSEAVRSRTKKFVFEWGGGGRGAFAAYFIRCCLTSTVDTGRKTERVPDACQPHQAREETDEVGASGAEYIIFLERKLNYFVCLF